METYFNVWGTWSINSSGLVDVEGSVSLLDSSTRVWQEIPVAFGAVSKIFEAKDVGLYSLKNSPTHVGVNFKVNQNNLTSLEHAPAYIGGDFEASVNTRLTSLNCASTKVMGDLDVQSCNLHNMTGCPQVSEGIWCKANPNLTDLQGMGSPVQVYVDYRPDLSLLPALLVQECYVRNITSWFPNRPEAVPLLREILNKYQGKGKTVMLNFALELKKAGFAGNARW